MRERFNALNLKVGFLSLLDEESRWILYQIARNAASLEGEIVEAGVYRGGSALILSEATGKRVHLFDTFSGHPFSDPRRDIHKAGDFDDTSPQDVGASLAGRRVSFYVGLFSETFVGAAIKPVALVHIDCDLYQSVSECCEYFYPRMVRGGFMVFDDYGFPTCPGARQAVDEFFADRPEVPIVLGSKQAVVVKQ